MSNYRHPSSLNPWQRYRQAGHVLRHSSRAVNPAWYRRALAIDLQLHIRCDGVQTATAFFDRKTGVWSEAPPLPLTTLSDEAQSAAFAKALLSATRSRKARGIGVILHVADEFSTSEIKPFFDSPSSLPELRNSIDSEPATVLEDPAIDPDQSSWRVIPYPGRSGGTIGTTVSISRRYAGFLQTLRQAGEEANFPVVAEALSAPLALSAAIPELVALPAGRAFVALLHYRSFTALLFFNHHADLLLVRSLQHRQTAYPPGLRKAILTGIVALELQSPELLVMELVPDPDPSLADDLRAALSSCEVRSCPFPASAVFPSWCPEPAALTSGPPQGSQAPGETFRIFREEKWAFQNFLPAPREERETIPTRGEMRLMLASSFIGITALIATIATISVLSFKALRIVKQEEWAFDPAKITAVTNQIQILDLERRRNEHWGNLLEDRSKAWATMELLSRLFPERCGVLVRSLDHRLRPETVEGQTRIGLLKEWRISGLAREEALELLNSINSQEGITARFAEVHRESGNSAFNPSIGNRSISVNLRTQENRMYDPSLSEANETDPNTYRFSFDLTIAQRFEAADPLAVTNAKQP